MNTLDEYQRFQELVNKSIRQVITKPRDGFIRDVLFVFEDGSEAQIGAGGEPLVCVMSELIPPSTQLTNNKGASEINLTPPSGYHLVSDGAFGIHLLPIGKSRADIDNRLF